MTPVLTLFDWIVLFVLLFFVVSAMLNGLINEAASLLRWIGALIAAGFAARPLAQVLPWNIEPFELAFAVAYLLVFLTVFLLVRLFADSLTGLAARIRLGGLNRILGGVFGAVKGMIFLSVVIALCAFTELPQHEDWKKSATLPFFQTIAAVCTPYLKRAADKWLEEGKPGIALEIGHL